MLTVKLQMVSGRQNSVRHCLTKSSAPANLTFVSSVTTALLLAKLCSIFSSKLLYPISGLVTQKLDNYLSVFEKRQQNILQMNN